MNDRDATITPNDLELLERISPELFAAVQANERFSHQAARSALASWKSRQQPPSPSPDVTGPAGDVTPPADSPTTQLPAVQLPLWPEPLRAVPNGFLRSALFGAIRKGRRPLLNEVQLAAIEGVRLLYTGPRLDQGDLDTWESILHTLRAQNMGDECRTTSAALLRLMGLSDTGKNRKILEGKISRLNASAIKIRCGRYLYMGSLLDWASKDEETQEWVIILNPRLAALFAPDQYTLIQWSVRRALSGQPLAQWLYGFYSSHASPLPIKVETLYRLSGSEAGELKTFTQKLKKALEAVERACAAAGDVFAWRIEDGLVYVTRTPTKAQLRHLTKHGK